MHHSFIDRYSNLKSPIHRLNARVKIAAALVGISAVVITPPAHPAPFILYAFIAISLWIGSKLPFRYLLSRIAMAIPFVAVMAIGMASKGLTPFLYIIARATLALTLLTILTSTTPFPLLLEGLRWYRLPNVLHSLLSFIYRFIYIIIDEFHRLNRGRSSREFGSKLTLSWRGRSWMVGTFLIRSIERSERVYQAMLSRGYANNN